MRRYPFDPYLVNLLYTVFVSVFAIVYYYTNWFKYKTLEKLQDDIHDAIPENVARAMAALGSTPNPFERPGIKVCKRTTQSVATPRKLAHTDALHRA